MHSPGEPESVSRFPPLFSPSSLPPHSSSRSLAGAMIQKKKIAHVLHCLSVSSSTFFPPLQFSLSLLLYFPPSLLPLSLCADRNQKKKKKASTAVSTAQSPPLHPVCAKRRRDFYYSQDFNPVAQAIGSGCFFATSVLPACLFHHFPKPHQYVLLWFRHLGTLLKGAFAAVRGV